MEKQIKELLEIFKNCDFTDILGLAKLLEVEEIDPFEDFIVEILAAFGSQPRNKRRKLLKLMRNLDGVNKALEKKNSNKEEEIK